MVKYGKLRLKGMRESTRLKVKSWLENEPEFRMPYVEIPKDANKLKQEVNQNGTRKCR